MTEKNRYREFNAATVELENSNLIEASAGTGKTYSIAILLLRLILEKQLSVKEILMVTFTKAAVAELQERIRLFIRTAYKVSLGKEIKDDNIKALVQQAIAARDITTVRQQLKDAVLLLDETAVLTIHSFCQQTLNEFAFETDQLFGAEMIQDVKPLVEEEMRKFWRKNVTTISVKLLEKLWKDGLRMDGLNDALDEHLSGKRYLGYDEESAYAITPEEQIKWEQQLDALQLKEADMKADLVTYITDHAEEITAYSQKNKYAQTNAVPLIASPQKFIAFLTEKKGLENIKKVYGDDLLKRIEACEMVAEEGRQITETVSRRLHCLAIREVSAGVAEFKKKNNLLSYDDMIVNLHNALVKRENPALEEALRNKYKAVFVDEFQDTDRLQYEIFEKAFSTNTVLFYIGDPKQSIYAWRKADIFTYFKAREKVEHMYSMNKNYRSSSTFIGAMNKFFLPGEGFDTFHFSGEQHAINYIHVDSPENNNKGYLFKNGEVDVPISIFQFPNNKGLGKAIAAQVAILLEDETYTIGEKGDERRITPSDIGILVRTGQQGREVKEQLSILGIPAVTIDDSKVLQSEQAKQLLYLMEAMAEPNRSSINRAMLSPLTGLNMTSILKLDDEATLSLFTKYKDRWQQDGIYTALMDFVADFGIRSALSQSHGESSERIIANFFQLIELVHQVQSRKNFSMPELISWVKRGIDGMATEGDEYEQRVESDEESVKIVTIHKSKGLEYKIVMAPYLDFVENKKIEFISFRDPDTGDYLGAERSRMSEEQLAIQQQQAEQENRRLLYVAITRAVYKCYIFKNNATNNKLSTLSTFLKALNATEPGLIQFEDVEPVTPKGGYKKKSLPAASKPAPVHFTLQQANWRKMSYTMLAAKIEKSPIGRSQEQDDIYDTFIFHTLKRGAKTGNLLHFIFETISFSDDTRWDKLLNEAVRRFLPGQQEQYVPMLHQLMNHVFNTDIQVNGHGFPLSAVAWYKCIAEFEFDFPVGLFSPDILNALSDPDMNIAAKRFSEYNSQELEGIMNGKMDLFFEHQGKYYILDWKSNYLGNTLEEYAPEVLTDAMNESNYHLQYLIYTVAAKKYLQTRLSNFNYEKQFGGVIYLFVRGMRNDTDTGIFTCKPPLHKILQLEDILSDLD
ncbi:DNA helicase/exodeoxyribonuclease V, beta subunit [Chitinophaga sp. CF118]|uniref:exodeoxyribonuclease V subunit beta n=1 Tax=Chitinophaga sp. CF118 TaxID=1884367 RepID=UPI0008F28154|nr:exodeoxyribonuclease V subunit beta [Chitinophaga sp. CF118]SFE07622.1 DNA helicase/exodeoxyribonuclease V, beta subunit [Chitinophaga sp. CF118]